MKRHKQFFSAAGRCRPSGWRCGSAPPWPWDRRCFLFRRCRRCAPFAAFAAGRVLAAGGFQLRAHSAGFWAGRGRKHRFWLWPHRRGTRQMCCWHRCCSWSKPRRWQALSFWRWCGCGGIAFGAHQLFNGAAGAVRCGAHRHPERRPTAVGDGEGVSACRWADGCGRCGCLRCCRPSGRDAAWPLASAGRAV